MSFKMSMDVSFIHINNPPKKNNKPIFKGIVEDFGSKAQVILSKNKIENEDKLILKDMFIKSYDELTKPERFIGSGFWGKVYIIDNNFVAKIGKNIKNIKSFIDEQFKIEKSTFRDLKTYFGEPVGNIGEVQILKNVGEHIPAGVPSKQVDTLNSLAECEKYYQEKYLPLFAKVPQESYDNLISDIAKLNNMKYSQNEYYIFDSNNPGNIVLSGNKLFLIDNMNTIDHDNYNSVGKVLEAMLYKLVFHQKVNSYGNNIQDAKEILKKIIIASEKANLPYDTRYSDEKIWQTVLKNCGIDMDANDFIQNLEIIRAKNPKIEKRIPKIEKYINKTLF